MKAIIFPYWFEAPDELTEFCERIGYRNFEFNTNFDLMFDPYVVEFCEQRLTKLWDEYVYKGRLSDRFRVGFAGAGYVRDIDTTKKWRIRYNNVDAPIIEYVDVEVNDYGCVSMVKE